MLSFLPHIQWVLRKIIGARNQRAPKCLWPLVKKINACEESLHTPPHEAHAMADQLRGAMEALSQRDIAYQPRVQPWDWSLAICTSNLTCTNYTSLSHHAFAGLCFEV